MRRHPGWISGVNVAQVYFANEVADDNIDDDDIKCAWWRCKANSITGYKNTNGGRLHFRLVEDSFSNQPKTRFYVTHCNSSVNMSKC